MKLTKCSQCGSNALNRTKRNPITKFLHPKTRCYQCAECGHKMLANEVGDVIKESKPKKPSLAK